MGDVQKVLEKLRDEAAECRLLSRLATEPEKRKLFATVAEHITGLAFAVENELAEVPTDVEHVAGQEPAYVADAAASALVQTTRSQRMHRWFPIVTLVASAGVLVAAGGAFVTGGAERDLVTPVQVRIVAPLTPQEDTKQAIAEFQSAEENKRNQQLDAFAARVDNFETARAEAFEKARAEIVEPVTKHDGERLRMPRHRKTASSSSRGKTASSNSRTLKLGWGLFR